MQKEMSTQIFVGHILNHSNLAAAILLSPEFVPRRRSQLFVERPHTIISRILTHVFYRPLVGAK